MYMIDEGIDEVNAALSRTNRDINNPGWPLNTHRRKPSKSVSANLALRSSNCIDPNCRTFRKSSSQKVATKRSSPSI